MGEFTWAYINGALTASGPTGSIQFRGDDEGCFATLSGSPNLRYLTGSQPEHGGNEVGILELTGNLNISGNLNIAGSFTTISSSNLVVQDPILGLAFGSASHASSVTGGVGDRGFVFGLNGNLNQALIWDQSSGSFVIGKVGSHGPDKTAYDVPFDNFSTFRAGVFQAVGNASQAKPTLSVIHLEDTNDAVEIIADAVTTADVMDVTADGLTTGKILKLVSDASSTGTRDLVFIHNDNTAAVNTTVLNIKNDAIAAKNTVTIESTVAETNPLLELKNSNAATDKPPILSLNRSANNETDDMSLGRIEFNGMQSGDDSISYVTIDGFASDVTSGDEGGKLVFNVMAGGSAADADSKNLLSIGGEDQTGGQQCEVVVNEDGIDCDFRVEGDSETHLIFAEAENDRVSIGASVDSPVATLEVTNASDGGVPLLQLNSNDTGKIALDVNAANIDANVLDITADAVTTANVINVSADALSTGIGLHIDDNSSHTGDHHVVEIKQSSAAAVGATALAVSSSGGKIGMVLSKTYSNTSAASVTGLILDFDKTGASTSNNTLIGAQIDMDNATATDGTNQMVGIQVTPTLTHAADAGITTVIGAEIIATGHTNGASHTTGSAIQALGADTNVGVHIVTTDGLAAPDNADIIIASSADEADLCYIAVGASGVTTIATVDSDAAAANLLFEVDGNISASATHGAAPFQIQASKLKLLNTPLSSSEDVAGASLTTSGRLCVSGSAELEGNVTVSGSLTVLGTTTSVSSSNVIIKDPIIGLGFGTASANTGAVGDRGFVFGLGGNLNQALIWDQSSASFVLGKVGAIGPDRTAYDVPFPDLSTLRLGSLEFLSNISGSGDVFFDGTLTVTGSAVFNEGGADNDFRVESDGETHMLFVDGGANRVSIGDDTDGPSATLEVTNANHANFNTTLVQLNNNEADQIALDINAVNTTVNVLDIAANAVTTANIINISADDSLTTGKIIAIDHNDAATTAVGPIGISYDFDKDGVMGNGQVSAYTGLDIDMHDAATNHNGSVVYMRGIDIDIGSTEDDGTIINIGIDISGSGGDSNIGLKTLMDDAAGSPDIVMSSSINNNDYGTISVGANGAMTVTTTDQSAADADLTFTVDGDISLAANGGSNTFQLQSNNFAVTTGGDVEILRSVGVGVPVSASLGMNVHHNPTSLKIGTGGGEVVAFGSESPIEAQALVAGYLYCMQDDGAWCLADADLVVSSSALLGIALGGAVSDGILLRGYFHMATASVSDHHLIGQPCYISEDAGHIDWIAPSAAGDTVRVIGYGTPTANLIYFDPDKTWIEL